MHAHTGGALTLKVEAEHEDVLVCCACVLAVGAGRLGRLLLHRDPQQLVVDHRHLLPKAKRRRHRREAQATRVRVRVEGEG